MAGGERGLTLLEVLAAFLIFAMVFTVLVGSSQNAVQSQGLSFRRLAANEIANAALADLEIEIARRNLPEIEEEETEREGFLVRIRATRMEQQPGQAGASVPGPDAFEGAGVLEALAALAPEVAPFVQRYDVEVEWTEANRQETVRRTTLAFDWSGAAETYADLFAAAGATPGGAGADGDADGSGEAGSDSAEGSSPDSGSERRGRRGGDGGAPSESDREQILRQMEPFL